MAPAMAVAMAPVMAAALALAMTVAMELATAVGMAVGLAPVMAVVMELAMAVDTALALATVATSHFALEDAILPAKTSLDHDTKSGSLRSLELGDPTKSLALRKIALQSISAQEEGYVQDGICPTDGQSVFLPRAGYLSHLEYL
ncbi:hypothetical protein H8959_006919 [Pygathrix nigripes]